MKLKRPSFANRTVIGVICILISIGFMFGISPIINKNSAKKQTVCQLNRIIEQGQIIKNEDIVKVEIGALGVAENVITDEKLIVGKYAKSDIYPKLNIFPEMLSDEISSADDIFSSLKEDEFAISVAIPSLAEGLSGKLINGDIVSIIVSMNEETTIPKELTYVKVITTTTNTGVDKDNIVKDENGEIQLPSTATLLVNQTQAQLLAYYNQNAKIHIALVHRGNQDLLVRDEKSAE